MKELGLFYLDGTFKSAQEIRSKLAQESIVHRTPLRDGAPYSFDDWTSIMLRRQKDREAFSPPNHVSIEIPSKEPIQLVFFGDVHGGSQEVDYERFSKDVAFVKETPNTYAIAVGDLIDGYFWGGATQGEDMANLDEQNLFIQSALKEMKGKLLVGFKGDHDGWAEKTGVTMYHQFEQEYKAHYMEGLGYISLKVGDVEYKLAGCHRHNGFSIYNHAHAAIRVWLDDAEGADICFTAHTHKKAIDLQDVKEFGGTAREAYFLSLGTYKRSDLYSRKKGFSSQTSNQMGASALILDPNERKISPIWNLQRGS